MNNFIPHYAFEARPFGLLLLALSLSVWSISRLWSDTYAKNSRYLWITSAFSPIVAAATIPLGIVAVIAMELSAAAAFLRSHQSRDFVVRWYARTGVVVGAVIVLMAIYGPAILNKSDNYWVEQYAPMSLASVNSVFRIVALQGGVISRSDLLCAAVLGLYLRWTSILGRLAAGLVVLYTALMFTISVFASLMISLLLARGAWIDLACSRISGRTRVFCSVFSCGASRRLACHIDVASQAPLPKELWDR